jgi:hypothetical protein
MPPPTRAPSKAKSRSSGSADRAAADRTRARCVTIPETGDSLVTVRTGGCLCGRVQYEVRGEPMRTGLCHCADCRKESGSVFATFAIWPRAAFSSTGDVAVFQGRSFCPTCGSRLFNLSDDEAEIRVGGLDVAPTALRPTSEIWVKRREPWLAPLPACQQFDGDNSVG